MPTVGDALKKRARVITVTIPGKPFPCPRPRWGQGRTFMPAAYEDWLNGARMLIRNAAVEQNGGRLIHGPLSVRLEFIGLMVAPT